MAGSRACYRCGQEGHIAVNCTAGNAAAQANPLRVVEQTDQPAPPRAQARAYASTSKDTRRSDAVVIGTLSILGHFAFTLFDSGSTHSFISMPFVVQAGFELEPLLHEMSVSTPAGVDLVSRDRVKDGQVIIGNQTLNVDLMVVNMTDFDVILGMDWLAENRASIDCRKKEVKFSPPTGPTFKFKGTNTGITPKVVSMMKAKKLVQQGGWAILACAVDVPIVNEFPDVFPDDLPGIPPSRAVEFVIKLKPGTGPISKAPYRMAPAELKELKAQLQDLLDKGSMYAYVGRV